MYTRQINLTVINKRRWPLQGPVLAWRTLQTLTLDQLSLYELLMPCVASPNTDQVTWLHYQWSEPAAGPGRFFKALSIDLYCICFILRRMHCGEGLYDNPVQNTVPNKIRSATEKIRKFPICRHLIQSSVVLFIHFNMTVSLFPNEACVWSLSINVFIKRLAKWRY